MARRVGLCVSFLLLSGGLLSGCGLIPERSKGYSDQLPSLGWYCITESKSQKLCQKRWLLNGRPVDDIVYETMTIDVDDPLPQVPQPAKDPAPAASTNPTSGQAVAWSRQPVTAVNALGEEVDLGVENLGPTPRKTKDTIDMWASAKSGKSGASSPEPRSSETRSSETRRSEPRSPGTKAKQSTEPAGYTVQLGAFSSFDKCRAFFSSQQFRGVPLYMRKIISDGSPWWIVAQGEFETFAEAEEAAAVLAKLYKPVVPWPRSWATIRALQAR